MARKLWLAVRPGIFWSYQRGSWQYDIMVGLILVFTFLTPRSWFRDQPRMPGAQQIVMLRSDHELAVFWVDGDLIGSKPAAAIHEHVRSLIERRTGKKVALIKAEPVEDSEGSLKGYLVDARF